MATTLNELLHLSPDATWQDRAAALQGKDLRLIAQIAHMDGLYASVRSALDVLRQLSATMEPREIVWDEKQHMLAAKWEGRSIGWGHTFGECEALLHDYRDFLVTEYGEITSEEGLFIARVNRAIACKGTSRQAALDGLFSQYRFEVAQ